MAGEGAGIVIAAGDADDIARALRRLDRWTGGEMSQTFDEIGRHLENSTLLRFQDEKDPEGTPWEPSGASYERGPDALGKGNEDRGKTLQETGRLMRSITRRTRRDRAEVGTNVVYAAIHQFGGKTQPRTIRPRRAKALAFPGADGQTIFRRSVQHPGSKVPQRAFLGVSARDHRRILEIVERAAAEGWR